MLSLIFSLVFLGLLEGAVFLSGGYFWLMALGALVFSSYIVWRAVPVKKPAFLVLAVLSALPAVLFLSAAQNLIFSQSAALISSAIFYALASGYLDRNQSATAPVSLIEFFAIVVLALVYRTMRAVSG